MEPLTREEQYLNRLTGEYEQTLPEEPITRKEQYLSRLCGSDNIIPQEPLTREEQFLANLCGEEVDTPEPLTRLEQYMAFAGGESETKPASPLTRQEKYWDEYQGGAVPEEKTLTGNPISVTDAIAQDALSLQVSFTPTQDGTPSIDSEPTTEPYLSKLIPRGNKEYYSLVGATVAWNQIVSQVHIAGLVNGLTRSDASYDDIKAVRVFGECTVGTNYTVFRSGVPIVNHVCLITLGNVELPTGSRLSLSAKDKTTTMIYKSSSARIAYELYVENGVSIDVTLYPQIFDLTLMFANNPAIADYIYTLEQSEAGSGIAWLKSYGFFTKDYYPYNAGELISANTSGHKIGSTTYPIDPTDLRGLFKLSNGKLYCEGDTRSPSGNVERKFEYRAYQSGDESLADAITDGTHTVVKLTTPTTETATPYTSPIDVEAGGTEEFIDNRTVPIPVGNETYYVSEYAVHGKTGVTVFHGATEDDPNPTEYEVEFTSQGTVYGGTVDIVTGVLTVTWAVLSNPQNLNWISNSSQGMKNFQTDRGTVSKKSGSNNWKCSRYSNGFIGTDKAEGIFIFNSGEVCIRDYRYWEHGGTSAEEAAFKASLADVTIAYELATPLTYQLTAQQVQMLLGNNYLETEDGTITLTYMAKAAERVRAMNAKLTQNKQTLALKKAGSLGKGDLK